MLFIKLKMYRTDKQFMKNPATASSRIYIGGLPKAVIADDLEGKFSKHGKILGLVINAGFAFIQYEFEQEAQSAIRAENGSVMMGRNIVVRQAFAGKEAGPAQNKNFATPPPKLEAAGPPKGAPPAHVGPPQATVEKEVENVVSIKLTFLGDCFLMSWVKVGRRDRSTTSNTTTPTKI